MKRLLAKNQGGYALVILLLALMAMGGVVLAGYTQEARQEVEQSRYQHNKRVLEQAKQALLMFAYNYPATDSRGPGRLPCPDHDDDGDIDFPLDCDTVGRFPWKDPRLKIQETLDASGETLWYAVSDSFDNEGAGVVDPNTRGMITLVDQSGQELYDGAVAGIAAVIIAPGPVLKRDNDANGSYEYTQTRNTGAQLIDPRNYLDTFNGFDNSVFTNDESDSNDDGFILGPIYDDNLNDIVVNDQLIIVTAEEVKAMAEQSTLDTYQDAINAYLANTGGIYPWLDDINTNSLTAFDADIGIDQGLVPVIFSNYFASPVQEVDPYLSDTKIRMEPQPGDIIVHVPVPNNPDVSFDASGDLLTAVNSPYSVTRYYWDGHPTQPTTLPMDGIWEMCPPGGPPSEEDCNQDIFGNFIGGLQSDVWLKVYKVTIDLQSATPGAPLEFLETGLISVGPYTPATGAEQAYVFGNYNSVSMPTFNINWEYDPDFKDDFNIIAFGGPLSDVGIGIVYYPELPDWALDDGWHHSVQMAIAEDYRPNGNNADCTVNGCLVVNNLAIVNNDKISLLVIAGEADTVDDLPAGWGDDLEAQFEPENDTSNITYDRRAGNDSVLVLQ